MWSFLGLGVKTSYDLYSEPVVAYVSSCVLGFSPQSNRTFRLGIKHSKSNTFKVFLALFQSENKTERTVTGVCLNVAGRDSRVEVAVAGKCRG